MNQKGAIAPLIAVLLLIIVVCVAFVVDLGHVHNVKGELQRAVDAAALAAARQLPDPDKVDAVAIATAASNNVDQEAVVVVAEDVILGIWDKENLTATPSDRFTPTLIGPNAVYVRATRSVDHIFFFFVDATQVTADAIALAEPINPILPLALISCIPTSALQLSEPGTLPGTDVCDIRVLSFNPDTDDTAAWTSLTFDANANDIRDMLEGPEGRILFEKVVFGGEPDSTNDGIENTNPDTTASPASTYNGCYPQDLSIDCGLGMIAGMDLAPASDFPSPPSVPSPAQLIVPGVGSGTNFDPMTAYMQNNALPRWYNLNQDGFFKTDDHFTRVWSLDGVLLRVPGENFAAFQARLSGYHSGTLAPPAPFNDGRLNCADDGHCFIRTGPSLSNQERHAIADAFPLENINWQTVEYWPDYKGIIEHTGYPKVGVTNATAATLLDTFLSNTDIATDEVLNCSEHDPPLTGDTLRLQVPVIFAGFCEEWKALSQGNENHELHYVGLADFYVTRAWKNPDDYACADNHVNGSSCGINFFDPPLGSGGVFSQVNENSKAIEGLFTAPIVDEAEASSTVKVLLVE